MWCRDKAKKKTIQVIEPQVRSLGNADLFWWFSSSAVFVPSFPGMTSPLLLLNLKTFSFWQPWSAARLFPQLCGTCLPSPHPSPLSPCTALPWAQHRRSGTYGSSSSSPSHCTAVLLRGHTHSHCHLFVGSKTAVDTELQVDASGSSGDFLPCSLIPFLGDNKVIIRPQICPVH